MSEIEKIYYNFNALCDDVAELEDTVESRRKLQEKMGREMFLKYDDAISDCCMYTEKQGFIWGFQYAMKLMTSQGTAVGKVS